MSLVRNLLEKRKARRKEERFVVEGPHLVEEADNSIDFVVYAENLPLIAKLKEQGVNCLKVSKKQFAEISEVETPQWILAVVKQKKHELAELLTSQNPLLVICVGVQDPGNLGTIIRTADAVGAAGVILSRGTVDLYNGKTIRSTMGSLFHLPIIEVADLDKTFEVLKKGNIRLIAADIGGDKDHYSADLGWPAAIVVGNEGAGLAQAVLDQADEIVRIPIVGQAESLNVGISTAVMLYEALRQRIHGR